MNERQHLRWLEGYEVYCDARRKYLENCIQQKKRRKDIKTNKNEKVKRKEVGKITYNFAKTKSREKTRQIKLQRAYGECLGTESRRRTW